MVCYKIIKLMTRLILVLFLALSLKNTNAQTLSNEKNLTQNLLFHLSKNTCTTGDLVAFKCYVINNINHTEDDHNLYIILADKNGTIISKEKYPLFNSSANGFINIPKDLEAGSYTIEAFTPYMINNKIIKSTRLIINNSSNTLYDLPIVCKVHYDNNKLICNIPNTFFVKTDYSNNLPASCELSITDKDDKQVQRFITDNNGIAKVTFTPLRNQLYTLNINNKKYQYALAKPDSIGVNMQVSFEKNILNFMLSKNYKIQANQDSFTVIAYQKNAEVYRAQFSFESYVSVTSGVNIAALPSGVIKLVLQNKDKVTVSATSIYIQNNKNLEDVIIKKEVNATKNSLHSDISFSSKANKFLSVSIEKINAKDSIPASDFDFFYTNNYTVNSSEEIVDFYEINSANKNTTAIQYKILTPNVKTPLNYGTFPKITDGYATIIKGKVYDPTGEKLYANGFLNFTYEAADSVYNYTAKVKSDGTFTLDSLIFYGLQKFSYKYYTNNNKEISCNIYIDNNKNEKLIDSLLSYSFNYKMKSNVIVKNSPTDTVVAKDIVAINSKEKTNQNKNKQNIDDSYSTGIYSGGSGFLIDNIKNPTRDGMMNGGTFVKNRIQNIAFQGGNIVNTKNLSISSQTFWSIGVVIDEAPAALTDLNTLTANDIGIIKFFEPGHISVSSSNPGGILAVYTKNRVMQNQKENTENTPINKRIIQEFQYEGFAYNVVTPKSKTDFVSTDKIFYWNPSIILSKEQNNFSFDTNKIEIGNTYKLSIRGYNELGKLIISETFLKN